VKFERIHPRDGWTAGIACVYSVAMIQRRRTLQALAALSASPVLGASHAAAPLRMQYFDSYVPMSFREGTQMRGILVDILEEVLGKRLGLTVEHQGFPWRRAQGNVESGLGDGMCTLVTPERLEYAQASGEPVMFNPSRLFVYAGSPLLKALSDARTLDDVRKINPRVISYLGSSWAKTNLVGFNVDDGPSDFANAVKMLAAGRGDVMIEGLYTMQNAWKSLPNADSLRVMPHDILTVTFYLLLGRKSPHVGVLPAFDKAMREFRKEAGYRQIFERYGVRL
jgi:polar amino acid transport system substrate-binding protein